MPTIIMSVIFDIPLIISELNRLPHAMSSAESGMRNIPMVIDVIAERRAMSRVTKLTPSTTTSGFTLAIQPGRAASPAMRITYLGMVA